MKILSGLWALGFAIFLLAQPDMTFAQSSEGDSDPGGGEPQTEPNERPDETNNSDPDVSDQDNGGGWSGDSGEPATGGETIDDQDVPGSESGGGSGTTSTSSDITNDRDDSDAREIVMPTMDGDDSFETIEVGR